VETEVPGKDSSGKEECQDGLLVHPRVPVPIQIHTHTHIYTH
jgi:hypothetical protein